MRDERLVLVPGALFVALFGAGCLLPLPYWGVHHFRFLPIIPVVCVGALSVYFSFLFASRHWGFLSGITDRSARSVRPAFAIIGFSLLCSVCYYLIPMVPFAYGDGLRNLRLVENAGGGWPRWSLVPPVATRGQRGRQRGDPAMGAIWKRFQIRLGSSEKCTPPIGRREQPPY